MPVPVGSFYINNSNQDFYLKELVSGVPTWVRKGNIRDDGSTGVLTVNPIASVGFTLDPGVVERIRFLAPGANAVGFNFATPVVTRYRFITSAMDFGMLMAASVEVLLSVNFALGFTQVSPIQSDLVSSMALGFSTAAALTLTGGALSLNLTWVNYPPSAVDTSFTYSAQGALEAHLYDLNLTTNAADPINFNTATHAAYDLGSAKDVRAAALTTGSSFGFQNTGYFDIQYSDTSLTAGFTSVGKTITALAGLNNSALSSFNSGGSHRYWRIAYYAGTTGANAWLAELGFQTNAGPNLGYDMAAALTLHTPTIQTPIAVNTTFTYTVSAAEANLYDGSLTTNAADPAGLTTATQATYDLGSAKSVTKMVITTGSANGWTNASVFKLQYSDTSLTAGFTDVTGGSFNINAGLSQATTLVISSGSHRYWRIVYVSGTTGQNAWLAELDFYA